MSTAFLRGVFAAIFLCGALATAGCSKAPTKLTDTLYISHPSPVWPQGHPITCDCGAYQIQAVLRAHDKIVPIPKLYVSDSERAQCSTLPWDFSTLLERYGGIKSKLHVYFSNAKFVVYIKYSLQHQHPLIVLIQATRGLHGLHWISIWGFDAATQTLSVYDSQYPTVVGGVGNTRYTIPFVESRFPWWITSAIEVQN